MVLFGWGSWRPGLRVVVFLFIWMQCCIQTQSSRGLLKSFLLQRLAAGFVSISGN